MGKPEDDYPEVRRADEAMDNSPYEFIVNHKEKDLKRFLEFKHRTFNATDLLYFIRFLRSHYQKHESLETAFLSRPIH